MPPARDHGRSPTTALLVGLIITLVTVVAYSWYITGQISGLRALQVDLTDRNRKASFQLLRIQNDLNELGLAMRDMLDTEEPYPLTAWSTQFARIRGDLDDALRREEQVAVSARTPEQTQYLATSVAQFWDAAARIFDLAAAGKEDDARAQIRLSLQARQAALSTAVSRLLIQNIESEEQTAQRVQGIYSQVQRQVYWFLSAALTTIAATGLYLIYSNRQLFAQLASLSERRRELAQTLIATREATLREISRELHDEFGQLLTAMGSMLRRAETHAPAGSPLREDLHEIGVVAQAALGNVRGLSQTLHPSILDELGLESTIEWYLSTVERQLGLHVSYERSGPVVPVDATVGIHVYRILQESLSNVARHSGTDGAAVRLRIAAANGQLAGSVAGSPAARADASTTLELEVEDRGKGLDAAASPPATDRGADRAKSRGLGLVAMRERAELLGGTIEFLPSPAGGTLIRLQVPLIVASDATAPVEPAS